MAIGAFGYNSRVRVIDGKDHVLGRLMAIVAKESLKGNKIAIVRCEQIIVSGQFYRRKMKFFSFLKKRCNVNPARGPFHHRSPARIAFRALRGMLPHKTKRGGFALRRVQLFEGIPGKFAKKTKWRVPRAERVYCIKPDRPYCTIGRISHEFGWKHAQLIKDMEVDITKKQEALGEIKSAISNLRAQAEKNVKSRVKKYNDILTQFGKMY